jgi:K+-sensing histidine kinase KdpD
MLRDARAQRRAGVDAVVAYWERHGRPATAARIGELELLPTRTVSYRASSIDELTRLWLDDSVADPAAAYLSAHGIAEHRGTHRVIVGLDGSPRDEWLIRYAADLAQLSDATLQGVHVRTGGAPGDPERAQLEADRRLLKQLGGSLVSVRANDVRSDPTATGPSSPEHKRQPREGSGQDSAAEREEIHDGCSIA